MNDCSNCLYCDTPGNQFPCQACLADEIRLYPNWTPVAQPKNWREQAAEGCTEAEVGSAIGKPIAEAVAQYRASTAPPGALPPLTREALAYAIENIKGGPKAANVIRRAWPFLAEAYRAATPARPVAPAVPLTDEQTALLDAYAAAHADAIVTGHESAKAYAALARANFIDALLAAAPTTPR